VHITLLEQTLYLLVVYDETPENVWVTLLLCTDQIVFFGKALTGENFDIRVSWNKSLLGYHKLLMLVTLLYFTLWVTNSILACVIAVDVRVALSEKIIIICYLMLAKYYNKCFQCESNSKFDGIEATLIFLLELHKLVESVLIKRSG
jgi:hypothetical protein